MIRSAFLLASFPFVLPLLIFCILFAVLSFSHHPQALSIAGSISILVLVIVVAITLVWLPIAYFINQWIIDRATGAREVSRNEESRLWNLLENLCISRGMTMPSLRIIEAEEMNAFASGVSDRSYSVTVTRGLLNALDDAELEGVLAHELTHIRNRDVQLVMIAQILVGIIPIVHNIAVRTFWLLIMSILTIYRAVFTLLPMPGVKALVTVTYNLVFWVGQGVAFAVGFIGHICSLIINFSLSRKREFLADAGAVELTKNPDALISALRKISGHSDVATTIDGVREMFFDNPHLSGLDGLFATHPPIEKRIEAIIRYARDVAPYGIHLPQSSESIISTAQPFEPNNRRLTADYYPLLLRIIAALEPNNAKTRGAAYARMRQVLANQLATLEPPLSESEIKAEQHVLEQTITRVEADQRRLNNKASSNTRPETVPDAARHSARRNIAWFSVAAALMFAVLGAAFYFFPSIFSHIPLIPATTVAGTTKPAEQAVTPVLSTRVSYDGQHTASLRYRDLIVTLNGEPTPGGDYRIPVATGSYQDRDIFSIRMDEGSIGAPNAEANLVRLDPATHMPQVVITSYSGGAHCCVLTKIATEDAAEKWHVIDGGVLDGDVGYQFLDLDGDGGNELVSLDNSFLYAFGCYACSYAPTRIKKLESAELKDVTKEAKYQNFLRQKLGEMETNARSNPSLLHSNGYIGGWVAARALVGEFDDAWRTMLANYDRNSGWVMEECLTGAPINKCPAGSKRRLDFPEALTKQLFNSGYITLDQKQQLLSHISGRSLANDSVARPIPIQPPPVQGLVPRTTERPSFNCAEAKSASPRLICADADLAQLDNLLGVAFQMRKIALPKSEQPTFIREQVTWIRERNIRCGLANKEAAAIDVLAAAKPCMAQAIKQRIAELSATGVGLNSSQQNGRPSAINLTKSYYVANTRPPDAFLSLRTEPSTTAGFRIAQLPNGTELKVLIQRPDRWWRVRVVSTGQEGWVLSGQGPSTWIECCGDTAIHRSGPVVTNAAQARSVAGAAQEPSADALQYLRSIRPDIPWQGEGLLFNFSDNSGAPPDKLIPYSQLQITVNHYLPFGAGPEQLFVGTPGPLGTGYRLYSGSYDQNKAEWDSVIIALRKLGARPATPTGSDRDIRSIQ